MEIQITEQLRSFLLAILLGMAVGVVYDLMRAVRLRHPRLTAVLDLGCCLFAAGGLFLFLMRQTDGQLRGYILLGLLAGPGRRAVPAAEPAGAVGDEGLQKNC